MRRKDVPGFDNTLTHPSASSPHDLDKTAEEVLRHMVGLMVACGQSPMAIASAVDQICRAHPTPDGAPDCGTFKQEYEDVPHIMTLWFSDPLYLDQDGLPLALPARGDAPSIEALLKSFGSKLNVDGAIRFLLKLDGLRKEGECYVPKSRAISFRGKHGVPRSRNMRVLAGVLRTLEHNVGLKPEGNSLFEFVAVNPRFPLAQLESFHERILRPKAMAFLDQADSDMHRRELMRPGHEPTVRLGVGVYVFEERSPSQRQQELKQSPTIRRARSKRAPSERVKDELPHTPSRLAAALALRITKGR